ncbi:MAG: hypothetical protein ACOYYU_19540 [Chloroflexota bacterium]
MAFNSQAIIQDVRAEFERLLEFVTGEQARTAKADSIERGLFKMLLRLGAQLLQLFGMVHCRMIYDELFVNRQRGCALKVIAPPQANEKRAC